MRTEQSYAAGAMSTMDVTDAASVLGLESYVGPLGDMTKKVDIPRSFDHQALEPARGELKQGLRVGRFEEQHAELAQQLLGRIKKIRKARQDRDRMRVVSLQRKQVWTFYIGAG